MKCSNCGSDALERRGNAYVCEYCRSVYQEKELFPETGSEPRVVVREVRYVHDTDRLGGLVGCFCWIAYPLAWIIWAVSRRTHPGRARTALVIALIQTALLLTFILAGISDQASTTSPY
jgi:hypothetical protein